MPITLPPRASHSATRHEKFKKRVGRSKKEREKEWSKLAVQLSTLPNSGWVKCSTVRVRWRWAPKISEFYIDDDQIYFISTLICPSRLDFHPCLAAVFFDSTTIQVAPIRLCRARLTLEKFNWGMPVTLEILTRNESEISAVSGAAN